MCNQVNGASFDVEYDTSAVKDMSCIVQFTRIAANIDKAIELKKQLDQRTVVSRSPQPVRHKNYGTMNNRQEHFQGEHPDFKPKSFV